MEQQSTKQSTKQSTEQSGVILTKKPRRPRGSNATILSTSYSAAADAAGSVPLIHKYEVGVDEAGRGPLFGRVYTGAVILPLPNTESTFDFSLLKDSKKFNSDQKIREVSDYIKQHAVAWAISYEEANVIDSITPTEKKNETNFL